MAAIPINTFASWQWPQEVVSGTWGKKAGQFYFGAGDTDDTFPKVFGVDNDGVIVISDKGNNRIAIYNPNGQLRSTLLKPSVLSDIDSWPASFVLYSGGNSFAVKCEYQKTDIGKKPLKTCFIDYNNNILAKVDSAEATPIATGYVLHNYKTNTYGIYSPTGQLIKTSATKPLELGIIQSKRIADNQYKVTITYFDMSWTTIEGTETFNDMRDMNGNFYGLDENTAVRYSRCGKELGRVTMPEMKYQAGKGSTDETPPAMEDEVALAPVALEYGAPILAPNGDIYTWKRTEKKYSIVKWTWVDDPGSNDDCPAEKAKDNKAAGKKMMSFRASAARHGIQEYKVKRSKPFVTSNPDMSG